MHPDKKAKLLAALRSGEYTQGKGSLRTGGEGDEPKHCCLGVACDVYRKETGQGEWRHVEDTEWRFYTPDGLWAWAALPKAVAEWYGVSWSEMIGGGDLKVKPPGPVNERYVSYLNDTGRSFEEIADLIEEQL